MDLKGKKVLVFGSGISGTAASGLLLKEGAAVILYDGNTSLDRKYIEQIVLQSASGAFEVILGKIPDEIIQSLDLVIMSPGVPLFIPEVERFKSGNIPIWGEIELAYVLGKGDVLAITGTNGKTTTTALLGEIMKAYRDDAYVVGNIGNPYTAVAAETTVDSIVVAEMSSFQLESIHTFSPKVSAILNISPDHLDRHLTMENYIAAKEKIAMNQGISDTCVLNYEDAVTREFGRQVKARVLYFSSRRKLDKGVYLEDGNIICHLDRPVKICHVNDLHILGTHNYENVMAAVAMAAAYGVPDDIIRNTVLTFKGVAHRIEFVAEKNGVAFYNDSKGTNTDAAIKAIQAMNRPTLLIGGGYDKDAVYDDWIQAFDGKVKKLVLVGATKEKIAATARRLGFTEIVLTDTFEEAVQVCADLAVPGDAVLLSPACASWGMFINYEERGDKFKELVQRMRKQDETNKAQTLKNKEN